MSGMNLTPYRKFAKEVLGFDFNDIELLVTAFTHRSYVNEHKKSAKEHNERLEFLGDAVLELAVTRYLFDNFPKQPEGTLTSWRSALVRTESIGAAGKALRYEPLIRMSRGEKTGSERARAHIVANAFEALLGAVYLDQGYETARKVIEKYILSKTEQILTDQSWRDPKSHLQEIAQKVDSRTPVYKVLQEEGPDHDKEFLVGVFVAGKKRGEGTGTSKQSAQQVAAKKAIEEYKKAKR